MYHICHTIFLVSIDAGWYIAGDSPRAFEVKQSEVYAQTIGLSA